MGRRKVAEDGTLAVRFLPQEVEFMRSTLVNWLLYADSDKKFELLSKNEILSLEQKLIELSDFFNNQVKESA